MSKISVGIVDDHLMVIKGLCAMLEETANIEIVIKATSGEDFLTSLLNTTPHVVLLDINLPGINGIELCSKLSKSHPGISIIGLSNFSETAFIKNMMRSGAKGYLLKNSKKAELVEAVTAVYKGETYLPAVIKEQLLQDSIGAHRQAYFIPQLSRREKEILKLISAEMTSSEIAEKLFISLKTVESHRKNLHQKLNVRNTAGLIKTAIQKGLIDV